MSFSDKKKAKLLGENAMDWLNIEKQDFL